jgi:hypothetical protein
MVSRINWRAVKPIRVCAPAKNESTTDSDDVIAISSLGATPNLCCQRKRSLETHRRGKRAAARAVTHRRRRQSPPDSRPKVRGGLYPAQLLGGDTPMTPHHGSRCCGRCRGSAYSGFILDNVFCRDRPERFASTESAVSVSAILQRFGRRLPTSESVRKVSVGMAQLSQHQPD